MNNLDYNVLTVGHHGLDYLKYSTMTECIWLFDQSYTIDPILALSDLNIRMSWNNSSKRVFGHLAS